MYVILILWGFVKVGYSQTIVDHFLNIPDTSILGLTKVQRNKIADFSSDNTCISDAIIDFKENNTNYAFEIVDIKNGFIRLIGNFEGHIQMCYWKLTNGNSLIGIYQEGCGPVCYIVQFDFYEFKNGKYYPLESKDIIPDVLHDFYKGDYQEQISKMEREDIMATLLFELPRTGKNLTAKWGNEGSKETYENYSKGNRMILNWNDGKFKKGDIYWK